ncbi:EamA family transporter [Vibrio methylphosphonaticus]|uniref:EamA family transporter n=1 Tax=Vibrio methylphosphonaticus TaxID=2946866 RepID=UPI00202A29EF|nr:EamA family transporter [Vibrio methylphosphonaticus]MCL9776873.1 EamA family transporter [Vibrio methylphosphonaticus]
MTFYAVLLVVFSALLHAGWNVLGKSNNGSGYSFTLGASLAPFFLLSPYLIWCLSVIGFDNLTLSFWRLLLFSAVGQVVYLVGLLRAYNLGDIGVIYPIARALPVLMVGVSTVVIGQALTFNAWLGFIILTLGCLLVPMRHFNDFSWRSYVNLGVFWAFIAAVGTTIYSVVDKQALSWLQLETDGLSSHQIAIFFLGMQFAAIALVLISWLLLTGKRHELVLTWQCRYRSATAGIMMALTYGMVLFAMTMVDNVSYVVALRQVSIIFGVLMGIWFLKEKWFYTRGIGVSLVLVGLLIALV